MENTILLHTSSLTNYRLLRPLAERLIQKGESIYFVSDLNEHPFDFDTVVNFSRLADCLSSPKGIKLNALERMAFKKYKKMKEFKLTSEPSSYLSYHKERLALATAIIKLLNPKILIVTEDGISGNCWLIEAARRLEIPILNCPYGYGTREDLEDDLERKIKEQSAIIATESEEGKKIIEQYPQWVKQGRFAGAIMYQPAFILAREACGISIMDAWRIQGGFSSVICTESEIMHQHYIKEGLSKERLILTGTLYCDLMQEVLQRNRIFKEAWTHHHKISEHHTSILVNWPPSYHETRANHCEFDSYLEMTQVVFKLLNDLENVQITVSLHPAAHLKRSDFSQYSNIKFSDDYIIELIPQHDIYVSCFSSTVRWAIAASKPVVNYNFYQFKPCDYGKSASILVDSFEDFSNAIQKLVQDPDHYHDMACQQHRCSHQWGLLDGECFNRIYEQIRLLAKETPKTKIVFKQKIKRLIPDFFKQYLPSKQIAKSE